jgi:peptide/nickel transport system substrate-binding protein
VLKEPWPDFMTFYGTSATGAGWVVPKKYVEKVGDDGLKKAPIGAGPYKFVRFNPGVELVLEAYEGYWRKTPAITPVPGAARRDHARRRAAEGRGRHRLSADRARRRGHSTTPPGHGAGPAERAPG